VLAAYREAVRERYRFFSYGDAMSHTAAWRRRCSCRWGTYGTVKAMTPEDLESLGAQIILGNTFHLMLRPGGELIADAGRPAPLHALAAADPHRLGRLPGLEPRHLRKISEAGVAFRSPIDGSLVFLTPERSMQVQRAARLSDIQMIFDECTAYPATIRRQARASMELSLRWAARSQGRLRCRHGAPQRARRCSASCRAACMSPAQRVAGRAAGASALTARDRRPVGR
jgi:hypothetical protein